jgi:hypothetical protein
MAFNCDDNLPLPFLLTGVSMSADRAFQPIQRRFSIATQPYEAIGMPPQICTTGPTRGFPIAVQNGAFTINFSDPSA